MDDKPEASGPVEEEASRDYISEPCPWCGSKVGLIKVNPKKEDEPFVCGECRLPPKSSEVIVKDDVEQHEIPFFDEKDQIFWDEDDDSEFAGFF